MIPALDTPPLCARPGCGQPVKHNQRPGAGWRTYCSVRCGGAHAPNGTRRANGQKGAVMSRRHHDARRCAHALALANVVIQKLRLAGFFLTDADQKLVMAATVKCARDGYTAGYTAGHMTGAKCGARRARVEQIA